MIKLNKLTEPTLLATKKVQWTTKYLGYISRGEDIPSSLADKYKSPSIKAQIATETYGKCAYCESKIQHMYPGDVEHILPKSKVPSLVFDWDNLTFACWTCNHEKLDYYVISVPLLNPYVDEPSNFIVAYGPYLRQVLGNVRGETTINTLKLNRNPLLLKRFEAIEQLNSLIERWHTETNSDRKDILKEQIKQEITDDKEYSFILKAYVLNRCGF